jgi:hypothetical protein
MADEIIVRNEASTNAYAPHPEGSYIGVCVDVIDLGEKVEQYQGNPAKIVPKVAIVFQTTEDNPDTGKPFELSVEKTVSFNERAGLRDFLGKWRGKTYTDADAEKGIPLHKLEGVTAMLIVEHKMSGAGRNYAKISNIAPAARGTVKVTARGYTRADYWQQRKDEYATAVKAHRATATNGKARAPEEVLAAVAAEDDGLPF